MSLLRPQPVPLDDPSLYINRDLSLLRFQHRVLEEARDEKNPLLERLKFLAIFGSNMDEFFMVRMTRIRREMEARRGAWTSPNELTQIHKQATDLYNMALECLQHELLPRLERTGVRILDYGHLSRSQKKEADAYFKQVV